jgi:serine/threonine protein kinase
MRELVADILAEQRREWEGGRHVLVEHFLERHPELRQDEESALDLIYGERLLREEFGPRVPDDSYLERFPSLAEKLRRQFAVDGWMDAAASPTDLEGATVPHPEAASAEATTLPAAPAAEPQLPPADLQLPSFVGYETLELLGHGTFGVVYKVRQAPPLNRVLALKLIRSEAGGEPLFLREVETLANLRHPHIVELYDFQDNGGRPYCTMEYVEGGTLGKKLKGGPLPPREAAELFEKLALAVQKAHEAGVVHRDLKPSNVLLDKGGSPKVTDFGLAKWLNAEASLLGSSLLAGTPLYMAPEQTRGKSDKIGPPADVWALGVMLYEALTGRRPFAGESLASLFAAIRHAEPAPPRKLRREVTRELEAIALKCLEKEPGQRYESARQLAEDLRAWLEDRALRHVKPRRWPALAWRFTRRHPALCGSAQGAIVVAAAALFAVWFLDPERPRREARADLRNGRPHEFKVPNWGPSPFRWVFATPDKWSADRDTNTLTIETVTTALYECIDDPGTDRYRFSMDVRHEDAKDDSAAGLFFGLRRGVTDEGVKQYGFFTFSFAELGGRAQELDSKGDRVGKARVEWWVCEKTDWECH